MALAITTKENVRALLGTNASGAADAVVDALIARVSDAAEMFLARTIMRGRRSEVYRLRPYETLISVKAWPIEGVTSIAYSDDDDFSDNDLLAASDFILRKELGQIRIKPTTTIYATGAYLLITYTGGLAADQAEFQSTYPDIEMAARLQVVALLNRMKNPEGSAKVLDTGVMYDKALTELDDFKRACGPRQRIRFG